MKQRTQCCRQLQSIIVSCLICWQGSSRRLPPDMFQNKTLQKAVSYRCILKCNVPLALTCSLDLVVASMLCPYPSGHVIWDYNVVFSFGGFGIGWFLLLAVSIWYKSCKTWGHQYNVWFSLKENFATTHRSSYMLVVIHRVRRPYQT